MHEPSTAFTQELRRLTPCTPWALDQLERFVWHIAARRQFERFALLGCWVMAPDAYVSVLEHARWGQIGIVVRKASGGPNRPAEVDEATRRSGDAVVGLDAPTVRAWREKGWQRGGIVWNEDPADVPTPWGSRQPAIDGNRADVGHALDRSAYWSVLEPSTNSDAWIAALEDLHRWVEHPRWASTLLIRRITLPLVQPRSKLRVAAAWLTADDEYAYVESHIHPSQSTAVDEPLLRASQIEHQQYLRIGELGHAPEGIYHVEALYSRYWEMALDSSAPYPQALLKNRHLRAGIAWQAAISGNPSLDRMSSVLHNALD